MKLTEKTTEIMRGDIIVNKAFDQSRVYLVVSVDWDRDELDSSVVCRFIGRLTDSHTSLSFPAQESMAVFYLNQMKAFSLEF